MANTDSIPFSEPRDRDDLDSLPSFPYIPPGGYSWGDYVRKRAEWQWERFLETPEQTMTRIMGKPV